MAILKTWLRLLELLEFALASPGLLVGGVLLWLWWLTLPAPGVPYGFPY